MHTNQVFQLRRATGHVCVKPISQATGHIVNHVPPDIWDTVEPAITAHMVMPQTRANWTITDVPDLAQHALAVIKHVNHSTHVPKDSIHVIAEPVAPREPCHNHA